MATQVARFSDGKIRSINCVRDEADAQRFQAAMTAQGYQVERYTTEQWREYLRRPLAPAVSVPHPKPADQQLPAVGDQVRFTRFSTEHVGTVVAHLRYPADHAHCPGWVRLHVRAPGMESMVDPAECSQDFAGPQNAAAAMPPVPLLTTTVDISAPLPAQVQKPVVTQPSLW